MWIEMKTKNRIDNRVLYVLFVHLAWQIHAKALHCSLDWLVCRVRVTRSTFVHLDSRRLCNAVVVQVAVVVSPSAVAARYNAPVSIDLCPNDISSTTFGPMWTHRTSAPEPVLWRFFFLLFCIHFMRRTSFISVINKQHNKSGIFQSMRNVRSSLNPLAWCLWCWVMLLIEIHMPNNSNTNIENKILFEWKKNGVLPKCTPQRERHLFLSFVVCSSLRCTSFFSRTCDAWTIRRHDICQCSVFYQFSLMLLWLLFLMAMAMFIHALHAKLRIQIDHRVTFEPWIRLLFWSTSVVNGKIRREPVFGSILPSRLCCAVYIGPLCYPQRIWWRWKEAQYSGRSLHKSRFRFRKLNLTEIM